MSVAGRSLAGETNEQILAGYQKLFSEVNLSLKSNDIDDLVVFPEMDEKKDTPEITTKCWGILNIKPTDIMCSNSRMIVKIKGKDQPSVAACTLLPYDSDFHFEGQLKDSFKPIKLNHSHCSRFCILGGGSCSQ